ncbi:MAG: alpha/beta hydrolase [Desulfobacterales bacterium]|nr:alpha/beta hydrolase [Desulfobacterales bacterium]
MTALEVNGTSLEYSENGEGEPLVLVHGSASDCRTWQFQQDAFAQHFRVIAYSRRYHWPNEPIADNTGYSMVEHVDDLEAVLASLDASPAHLVGHSNGAFLCLLLAIRAPKLVRSLALTEPPVITLFVSDPPKPTEILRLLATRPRAAIDLIKFGATGIAPATKAAKQDDMEAAMRIVGRAILGRDFYNRLSEERLEQMRANAIRAEFLDSSFPPLDSKDVNNIQTPTLLVTGQHSAGLFIQLANRLEELLPHAERVKIANTSHIVHEDDPPAYNKAVLSFLSKHQ